MDADLASGQTHHKQLNSPSQTEASFCDPIPSEIAQPLFMMLVLLLEVVHQAVPFVSIRILPNAGLTAVDSMPALGADVHLNLQQQLKGSVTQTSGIA